MTDASTKTPTQSAGDDGVWRPFDDAPLLTPPMARGPKHVPQDELLALRRYLGALVEQRAAPVHVNVAFNAVYFGYDLDQSGYTGGLTVDTFPLLTHTDVCSAIPVGAMVRVVTGSEALYGEIVYREGAHPAVEADGTVPAWLSGAPAAADGPAPAPADELPNTIPALEQPLRQRERLIVDFGAFTSGLAPTQAQIDRLRRRGRYLDPLGHLAVEASYDDPYTPYRHEAEQYRSHLLSHRRDELLSAAVPRPLTTLLEAGSAEENLSTALTGVFATIAYALSGLDTVRLWGAYAFSRIELADRLSRKGVLGREDLAGLAMQLANSAVPSRASRWASRRTVTYSAIGPRLRALPGAERQLRGLGYAAAVAHANTVIGDHARREANPETGLLDGGVHLRADDTWQCGGVWRAERPGRVPDAVDVTDPLGLGWAEACGLPLPGLTDSPSGSTQPADVTEPVAGADPAADVHGLEPGSGEAGGRPQAAPEPEPTPMQTPETVPQPDVAPEDDSFAQLIAVSDSQVAWRQTLRLSHITGAFSVLPAKLAPRWETEVEPGTAFKLALHHDGRDLEDEEASQEVIAELADGAWVLRGVSWPIEFFPGLILFGTWQYGGRMLRLSSRLLDTPLTVDGFPIEHWYDPRVVTIDGSGQDSQLSPPGWPARILTTVRCAGLLDVHGRATIAEEHLLQLVLGTEADDRLPPGSETDFARHLDQLIAAGKLRRDTASSGSAGALTLPGPQGVAPVSVIVYEPAVARGVPRKPPVPEVLRGLMKQGDLAAHLVVSIDVAGHLRRLPPGHRAGIGRDEQYQAYRNRYRLVGPATLPSGYTFVGPTVRTR